MRVECPACGRVVDVRGLPATCPFCQRRIAASIAPPLINRPGSRSGSSSASVAASALELEEAARREAQYPTFHAPVYVPPPSPVEWTKPVLIGAGVLVLAALLFLIVHVVRVQVRAMSSSGQQASTSTTGGPIDSQTQVLEGPRVLAAPQPESRPEPNELSAPVRATAPQRLAPMAADLAPDPVTDAAINRAIERGVTYLIDQLQSGPLAEGEPQSLTNRRQGEYALVVLALGYAGQSTFDQRLSLSGEVMTTALERLKQFPMEGGVEVYTRALRLAALSVHNRREDQRAINDDLQWLLAAHVGGAYDYRMPPPDAAGRRPTKERFRWDNSNTQYGTLGVWMAAEAGHPVPSTYWQAVRDHWTSEQDGSGGWGYQKDGASVTMTSAGINMLAVALDHLNAGRVREDQANMGAAESLERGVAWLAQGGRAVQMPWSHHGYALYGLERAGLASGYKRIGGHDWFRELAAGVLESQGEDGSWERSGGDGIVPETAFRVLFLSRGRHPILFNKLRYAGDWNNHQRDLLRLSKFVFESIERPVNWQVVTLDSDWTDWMDAPVLYIAGAEPIDISDADAAKLREFALNGGLIFTHADADSDDFTESVRALAERILPEWAPLANLPEDHPVYSALYNVRERPPLMGVSNGSRLLLVHAPTDLAEDWQFGSPRTSEPEFQMGTNVFIYATGKHALRHRMETPLVREALGEPIASVSIGRLRHEGNWNPEPAAWARLARQFRNQTSIRLDVRAADARDLDRTVTPIVHVTSTGPWTISQADADALRRYVDEGGVLLVDVTGGDQTAAVAMREQMLALFPGAEPADLTDDHPLLSGGGEGMSKLEGPDLRVYAVGEMLDGAPPMQILESGKGAVILSPLDVTSGLLGTTTWGVLGYEPDYAGGFVTNLVLWAVNERGLDATWLPSTAPLGKSDAGDADTGTP